VDATKTQGADFRAPRVGRGLAVGDYDNDGYLDFLVSNNGEPAQLFHNDGGGASRQGTVSTVPKSPAKTAASAAKEAPGGSKEVPGAPPFASQKGGSSTSETAKTPNHWFAVRLIGTKSNRDAIGASLKLTAGDFVSYDQSKGGMSYCSAQDPRIYFGLGAHDHVDALEIRWPSGAVEIFKDLAADQILAITEGAGVQPNKFPRARPH
jgi:hypothetical protein